jgi:hypothetical protein
VKRAVNIFFKWWSTMALLYERHGPVVDIELKPGWEEVQQLQRGWVAALAEQTGSDEAVLFEAVQAAIGRVLGRANDTAVSLTVEEATQIIHTAVEITLASEARKVQAAGGVN